MLLAVVDKLFLIYQLLIFIRIIGSWFPQFQDSIVLRFAAYYADPYLNIFKRIIPPLGMIDFSPIIALFALQFIEGAVLYVLKTAF